MRCARSARGTLAVGALTALALLSAGPPAQARTVDRDPVPATVVRRFYTPVVNAVLGPPGGRSYARAADRLPSLYRYQLTFWWTRAPGDIRWTRLNGQPSPYYPWLLAPDPARPETVYAVDPNGVVLRSTDAGATWETRGQAPSGSNWQFLVVGPDLFVSGLYTCSPCRSRDGGKTWEGSAAAGELVVAPGDPRVVYSLLPGSILRSADGARSFVDVSPAPEEGAGALAVASSGANVVYALAVAPGRAGAFLSRTGDGGASWTRLAPPASGLAWSVPAVDPASALHVVILGGPRDGSAPGHLFESFDGDGSWTRHMGAVSATASRFAVAPGGEPAIEAFGERGLFTTADAGDHWAPADQGILADGDLVLAGAANGDLYVAATESGSLWRSRNAGRDWELRGVQAGLSSLTPDPFDPERLVSLNGDGAGLLWSDDGGRTWSLRGAPEASGGPLFIYSLAFDPHRRDTLYAATMVDAWRSADRGVTWSRLTASLPSGLDCGTFSCHDTRDVESIIPDPFAPSRLYALAMEGYVDFRTEDGGATWRRLNEPALASSDSPRLRPDPRIPGRLYWGLRTETKVYVSDHAGASPWRNLLQTLDFGPVGTDAWLTFDPKGRLVVAPQANSATFLRRIGDTSWERLAVALPSEQDVRILDPLVPAPGGRTRMFLQIPGFGLYRADLPEPP
jgi:photosystem II stability/assembly factor-like uncharacterized protein